MTTPPDDPHLSTAAARDPWDRFGWVMGVVWLVFLGFPIGAAVTDDGHWAWRSLAVALIVLFGAVYTRALVRMGRENDVCDDVRAWGWRSVALLWAVLAGVTAIIGPEALGMMPFVAAMSMFVLPLRAALVAYAVTVAVSATAAWIVGRPFSEEGGAWYLVLIVVLVGAITAVVRVLDGLAAQHRTLTGNLAVATERDRVARDVHDVLGHSLTAMTVKAELAERLVDTDPKRAKAELAQIQAITRQSLAEIRATVGGLRIARLTDQIEAARDALGDAGITVELPADPSVVDPRHRVVLAWALREAVTNAVRHSSAATCRVELGTDWLTFTDDGHGLRGGREGNGLRGLRERVGTAGGMVHVEPGPDGVGTRLRVRL